MLFDCLCFRSDVYDVGNAVAACLVCTHARTDTHTSRPHPHTPIHLTHTHAHTQYTQSTHRHTHLEANMSVFAGCGATDQAGFQRDV